MNSNFELESYKNRHPEVPFKIEQLDSKTIRNRIEFLGALKHFINPHNQDISDKIINKFNENYELACKASIETIFDSLKNELNAIFALRLDLEKETEKEKEQEKEKEGGTLPYPFSRVSLDELKEQVLNQVSFHVKTHHNQIEKLFTKFRIQDFVNMNRDTFFLDMSKSIFLQMYLFADQKIREINFHRVKPILGRLGSREFLFSGDFSLIFNSHEPDPIFLQDFIRAQMRGLALNEIIPWISGPSSLIYHSVKHPTGSVEKDYVGLFKVHAFQIIAALWSSLLTTIPACFSMNLEISGIPT
jgi:hypothetical protein